MIVKICPICESGFTVYPSSKKVCCSNKCAAQHNNKFKPQNQPNRIVGTCLVCGKSFSASPSYNRKFCSHRCANKVVNLGKIPWNKGKAWPDTVTEKISKGNTGKKRTLEFRQNQSVRLRGEQNPAKRPGVGMRISLALKGKPRLSIRGPNHWAWTGGKDRADPDFLLIRLDILKRDGHCQLCGATEKLLVHHRDENKFHSKPDNLITLCRSCHRRVHNIARHKPTAQLALA